MKKRKFSEGLFDIAIILEALPQLSGLTVLDAGCGNGYMAKIFAEQVGKAGKVYAMDINPSDSIAENDSFESPIINCIEGDITQKSAIADSSIDLIYLSTVFHIFSSIQVAGFEQEVLRIAKSPLSTIAIVNIHKKETPFGPPLKMRSSPDELRKKLSFTPLDLIELDDYFYLQLFSAGSEKTK